MLVACGSFAEPAPPITIALPAPPPLPHNPYPLTPIIGTWRIDNNTARNDGHDWFTGDEYLDFFSDGVGIEFWEEHIFFFTWRTHNDRLIMEYYEFILSFDFDITGNRLLLYYDDSLNPVRFTRVD